MAQRCDFGYGDVVDSKFQVENVLGEGTFGKVYAVKDHYGTLYALKLLRLWEIHPDLRQGLIDRFDMEYETGLIKSDYLVHAINHGLAFGNPYIVMEYCGKGDLVSISKKEDINYSYVATCILNGLKALHQNGKVHRDLKPENVLEKSNGVFALTDFGIAGDRNKRMTERNILGKPKQLFGTYAYMPPEQVRPKHRDSTVLPTTDIFSFGVLMYQLLTGSLPFGELNDEGDLPSYLRYGREGRWNRETLRYSDSKDWEKLIDGCLQPQIGRRIQSADEAIRLVPASYHYTFASSEENTLYQTKIVNGVLLRIMHGEDYGKVFMLDGLINENHPILKLGRKDLYAHNDIEIVENQSSYISRQHCTLELDYDSGNWIIRDGQWQGVHSMGWKHSTNGTYVNSKEVNESGMPFFPGDIITIGDVKLRVEAY